MTIVKKSRNQLVMAVSLPMSRIQQNCILLAQLVVIVLSLFSVVPVFAAQPTALKGLSSMDSLDDIPNVPIGPYKVGFKGITNISLTNGPVNIGVWYPASNDTSGTLLPGYMTNSGFPVVSDSYMITTNHSVYNDALIHEGKFPTIYYLHGDLRNPDASRFSNAQTGEKLASHGIIYVTFTRNAPRNILEANALIEYMQDVSEFKNSINKQKIGIEGQSAGGVNGSQIAATNPNVKGFVSDDGFSPTAVPNVPMMRFGTTYIGLSGQDKDLFQKSQGRPLIFIHSPRFRHLGLYDTLCETIQKLRELAIQQVGDSNYEPLLNPLNNINGIDAYSVWKINVSGITGGDHACNTESWEPTVTKDAFSSNYGRYVKSDIQTKFAVLYRLAFWKNVFFNDTSLNYLIDPLWFSNHFDPNVVRIYVKS